MVLSKRRRPPPRDAAGDLQEQLPGRLEAENSNNERDAQETTVIIERGRIRDGVRRGEFTSEYFIEMISAEASCIVWRGFNYRAALEAAAPWARAGAVLEDRCASLGRIE
jgi:hypothetical protein